MSDPVNIVLPPGFQPIECAGLLAVMGFVGVMMWLAVKRSSR